MLLHQQIIGGLRQLCGCIGPDSLFDVIYHNLILLYIPPAIAEDDGNSMLRAGNFARQNRHRGFCAVDMSRTAHSIASDRERSV